MPLQWEAEGGIPRRRHSQGGGTRRRWNSQGHGTLRRRKSLKSGTPRGWNCSCAYTSTFKRLQNDRWEPLNYGKNACMLLEPWKRCNMTFLGPSGPIFYIDIDMYIFFPTSMKRTASIAVLQTHRSMGHTGQKRERERENTDMLP